MLNNPINAIDPLGLFDLVGAFAKVEGALKPYVVGAGLVVTGGVTAVAGGAATVVGYGSIPATGPAGVLVGTTGVLVFVAGAAEVALGLDVYADELRRRLGLPEWFDVIRNFELFTEHEQPKPLGDEPCE